MHKTCYDTVNKLAYTSRILYTYNDISTGLYSVYVQWRLLLYYLFRELLFKVLDMIPWLLGDLDPPKETDPTARIRSPGTEYQLIQRGVIDFTYGVPNTGKLYVVIPCCLG